MEHLAAYIGEPFRVGDPCESGPLAVFPVFGPEPRASYVSFAQGRARGVQIRESPASDCDLLVDNPSGSDVLLHDGEQLLAVQQSHALDSSVLVASGSTVTVPVREGISHNRPNAAATAREGQSGAIAAIHGAVYAFDYVSRPDVYADLHSCLVGGYLLEALGAEADATTNGCVDPERAHEVALLTGDSTIIHRGPSHGVGEKIRIDAPGLSGCGLVRNGELIQLSVFPNQAATSASLSWSR